VLLVHSSLVGEEETLERLAAGGLEPEVVARAPGPLGPLMGARGALFEEEGLLEPGHRDEELVVIRGRRRRSA
jgi:release factor glutamine methyltransferase